MLTVLTVIGGQSRKINMFVTRALAGSNFTPLLLLLLLISLTNFFWLSYNTLPPHWDWAAHMLSALKYHQAMSDYTQQPDLWSLTSVKAVLRNLLGVDQSVYPPLFPLVGSFMIFIAGPSIKWLSMTNMLFMALLLYGLFKIGKKIHSEESGVLSCIILCFYPVVFSLSRQYMLEIALLAITALSIYFLLYSEEFRNRAFTALFGVSVGVGLLIKPTYLSYIVGPVCYVASLVGYKMFIGSLPWREGVWRFCRFLPSLAVGLALAALWYGPNWDVFTRQFRRVVSLDNTGISPFGIDSFLYHPNTIVHQIGLPFFILLLYGLYRLTRSVNSQNAWFLWIWALSIYLIHTSSRLKTGTQVIAILFPVAIISAIGILSITRWKRTVVTLVLLFGFFQFATLSIPENWLADKVGQFKWAGHYASFPKKQDWKIEDALGSIGDQRATVAVMSDHRFINPVTIRYYVFVLRLPLMTTPCHTIVRKGKDLRSYDFVIAKSDTGWIPRGAQGDYCLGNADDYVQILKQLDDKSQNFNIFRRFPLPDGTEMLIYKKS